MNKLSKAFVKKASLQIMLENVKAFMIYVICKGKLGIH